MARTSKPLSQSQNMTIMGHIQELQRRLVISALFLIVAASSAYFFKDQIIAILLKPLGGQSLMYLNPAGGFSFILMVSIYVGVALSAPIILHQVYCFVRPALAANVQKKSIQLLVSSSLLLVLGVLFGYFYAIPGALQFLQEFAGDYINASLTADAYLHFIVAYTLGLGLVFQLPLLLMLIHWIKPLTPGGLMKSQRWIIILSFVAAAIITPTPDPLNQTIIALPIILVYQLGVISVLLNIAKTKRKSRALARTLISGAPEHTPPVAEESPPQATLQPLLPQAHEATQPIQGTPRPTLRSLDGVRYRPSRPNPAIFAAQQRSLLQQPSHSPNSCTRPLNKSQRLTIDGISPTFQLSNQ